MKYLVFTTTTCNLNWLYIKQRLEQNWECYTYTRIPTPRGNKLPFDVLDGLQIYRIYSIELDSKKGGKELQVTIRYNKVMDSVCRGVNYLQELVNALLDEDQDFCCFPLCDLLPDELLGGHHAETT